MEKGSVTLAVFSMHILIWTAVNLVEAASFLATCSSASADRISTLPSQTGSQG